MSTQDILVTTIEEVVLVSTIEEEVAVSCCPESQEVVAIAVPGDQGPAGDDGVDGAGAVNPLTFIGVMGVN